VAAPDPFPGDGGFGPPRPVGAGWPVMDRPPHAAVPDLPGETGSAKAPRKLPSLPGDVEAPDL
jgi:hypothetical protein